MSVRSEFLRLLREDEEFRYAVVGLLGLEDLRVALKAIGEAVSKLVDSQRRLEERVVALEERVVKLDERVVGLEERVAGLEEKVIKLDERVVGLEEKVVKLDERIVGLAERVVGLEEKVVKLDERVVGLEEKVVKLDERVVGLEDRAVKLEERVVGLGVKADRLEESHIRLVESVSGLAREVGRLSESVGFGLEDVARVVVPGWLFRHEGIVVDDLVRRFFVVDGVEVELNLYGEGLKGGVRVVILGEARSRIYGDDVKRFYDSVSKVSKIFKEQVYLLMFGFYVHPSAEREAESRGVRLIASYMR
ncbi:MAG: hypothetical protein QW282_03875 [Nitrososphaerales archaeon]